MEFVPACRQDACRRWRVASCLAAIAALMVASAGAAAAAPVQPAQATLPVSTLPLRLTGIVLDDVRPDRATAFIHCVSQGGRRGMFRVGDQPCNLAEIREIREDAVVLRNLESDRLELLPLPEAVRSTGLTRQPAPPASADSRADAPSLELPRETVRAVLANLPDLLSSARAVPRYTDAPGGARVIEGFEVTEVAPSGAAERLGLRRGDVILDVNGQLLDGMPTVMRLFGEMASMTRVTLTVLRDGRRLSVSFDTK
jgi:type II secretion system protein C